MKKQDQNIKIVAGNSNMRLATDIANYLKIPLTECNVRRFADMEVFVEILENVRGEDVFAIQSTSYPANDHLMELLILIDALKRSSARRITAVIPYYGYARQDRRTSGRTPISAKLVANLITKAGAWLKLPNGEKIQGKVKLAQYLEENPDQYETFRNEVFSMVGLNED